MPENRTHPTHRPLALLAGVLLLLGALAGCGSSGEKDAGPSPYGVGGDSVQPGEGALNLAGHRYPFEVVNCGTGPIKSDEVPQLAAASVPPAAQRVWGVYGNGNVEGRLFTVAVTQYRSQVGNGPVTVTDTVLVRMDVPSSPTSAADTTAPPTGDPGSTVPPPSGSSTTDDGVEHLGLTAQRFHAEGDPRWTDPLDPTATEELVARKGDTYIADGMFGPSQARPEDPGVQPARVVARCPAAGDPASSSTTSAAAPATTSTP